MNGSSTVLLWLRDKKNNWMTELENEIPPDLVKLTGQDILELLPNEFASLEIYDPWEDRWSEKFTSSQLPESVEFKRSLVIKVKM